MKNFTNNFKQFTSRLSARWLIMALMMLVGTSSAWAAQFETNGTALSIKLNTSNENYNYGLSGHDVTKLNVVSGPIHIKEAYIHVDKSIGGDFCGAELRIKDGDGDRKVGDFVWQSDDNNSRQTWKWSGDFEVKPITEGNHTFQIYVKGNFCNEDKYLSNGGSNYSFSYTIEATDPCATTYYLKHEGWSNGKWGWSDAMTCNDGIYTLEAKYNGSGCNYNTKKDDNGAGWIPNNPNTIQSGTLCIFTFDPSGPSITITPKCTTANFSVSLPSNGVVNKGDANITASTEGTHSPAVAWTSSDETVATIDEDGNIHALKGGKTTITATTKGTDSYCKDTKKDAELTVKETPTIDITGATYGCNENKTLTATVTGVEKGTSYTIKWYKDDVEISTGSKYTATESGTYSAQVTGTYINETSDEVVFTKYPATPVPQITLASNSICDGNTTTLTIDHYDATNYSYKLYNGNNVVESPVFNDGVYTLSSAGNYYVTATPISGVCQVESAKQQTATTLTVTSVTLALDPTSAPICSSATIADISTYVTATVTSSEDANVNWYASEDATEELTDNTELKAQIYYAEAVTTSGCKSDRQSFEVTSLMTKPSAPVIKANKNAVCSGESVELTLEYNIVGETYKINDSEVFTDQSTTWTSPALDSKTDYIVTATNSCGSTNSEEVTINVTTTPTITGLSATQPNKEITLSSEAGANTKWETTSGSTLTPETGAETVFKATENGNYTITAKNTANNITCSATHSIVVNDKFYIYIRRPKSGTTTYNQWYEKTNDADKGAHPWMKNGSEYKTGDDYTNNKYDGYGPESTFTDCNGNLWDAFIAPGTSFFIHAPNTFQEGGQEGYATFTQVTNITSTATDLYYTINQWAGGETKGTTLSPASEPNRIPEVAVPVLSIDPVSGIICQGAEATITVTNPENGVSYKLNYEGKDQTNSIAYTGTENVKFAVTEAGTYLVKAETTSGTCKGNAVSIAREIQVITTSISFEGAPYVTTPWEPITIIVNVPKGYNYTFNDTQLTQIASPDTPIKKVSGSEYTYSFPRPQEWGTGNSQTGDSWGEKTYTISATLNGVTETCGTATATVKLQDEGNDNCRTTNN